MVAGPVVRLVVAVVVLVAVGGGLWWVASLAPTEEGHGEGDFRVALVGPEGTVLADRSVRSEANPLAALRQLGLAANFTVEVEQQPWIGSGCTAEYVVGIAGHRESASGGWNYYVRGPGGSWEWKSAGAACHGLEAGDEVEWCWVELDVCRHHAP